jgi:hypothetical protein
MEVENTAEAERTQVKFIAGNDESFPKEGEQQFGRTRAAHGRKAICFVPRHKNRAADLKAVQHPRASCDASV